MNTSLTTPIRVFDVSQADPGDLIEAAPAEECITADLRRRQCRP
jgi:hypothetical protein